MKRTCLLFTQALHCLLFLLFLSTVPCAAQSQTCEAPPQIDMTGAKPFGTGAPGSCTQAELQRLINEGGKISCNCGSNAVLTLTSTLQVPNLEVVIDGNGLTISGNNSVRIFRKGPALNQANGSLLALQNLKLINARLSQPAGDGDLGGAAIACAAFGSLKVFNVLFENNETAFPNELKHPSANHPINADACGAVHTVLYKEASFVNCIFKNNKGANGGAVGGISSAPTFINCLFENNRAVGSAGTFRNGGQGGAIYVDGTFLNGVRNRVELCGCVFKDNFANHQAGGFYVVQYNGTDQPGSGGATGSIDRCIFENNTCLNSDDGQPGSYGGGLGGGIFYMEGDLTISNSTFTNNSSVNQGGGIWYTEGRLSLANCTLNRNKAGDNTSGLGGGLALNGGDRNPKTVTITNCTFAENQAGNFASAIFNSADLTLTNTLFYNNLTGTGYQSNPYAGGTINGGSSLTVGPGNLQWPENYNAQFGPNRENWLTNNVLVADAQLQPLADNGGPTKTMALLANSPAVNQGSGSGAPATDQRGQARVGNVDIGAFEYSVATPGFSLAASPTTVNVTQGSTASSSITVTPSGGFTGSVVLSASGLPAGVTATFNPASVTTSGSVTLTFTATAAAAPGTYNITVTGTGPAGLSRTTTVSLIVAALPTPNFSLSANPTAVNITQGSTASSSITLTASGGFTGSVSLTASGLPAGVTAVFSPASLTTSGSSTLTFTAAATAVAGTYNITITGTGPADLSRTTTIALTVTAPPTPNFSLAANPTAVNITQGSTASSSITVTPSGGFTGSVSLSVSGLPTGVTAAFSPASVTTSGSSTLTFTAAAAGTYTVTITGTGPADLSRTATVSLIVAAPPTPNFSLSATAASVLPGNTANSTITLTPSGGFTGSVSLSANGLPAGVTAVFSPASLTTSGSSTLTFTAAATAVAGTYNITITGTGPADLSRTTTIALTVTAPQPNKQDQTITFDQLPNKLTTDAPFAITATATSTLPVTLTLVSGPAALSGNTLTLTGTAGTVMIRATQAGNASFNAAPAIERSFQVSAPGTVPTTPEPTALRPRNIFSPNGDGSNEVWQIDGIEQYPEVEVAIYNSNGQQLLITRPYQNNWDGTYQGAPLPEGVYYFTLRQDGKKILTTGAITLVR